MLEQTDTDLVRLAGAGHKVAFAELVGRHRALLVAVCGRLLMDPELAEDAAQEAILRALLVLDTLRRPEQFGSWLAGIGLNVSRRWLRRRVQAADAWSWEALVGGARIAEPVDTDPRVTPDVWTEEQELARAVRRAVEALPAGQRAAVLLAYLAGMTQAETAAALGVTLAAVKTRLHNARATLRESLWTLWNEEDPSMALTPATPTAYTDVRVWDVRGKPATPEAASRTVVLLEESGGDRVLPIWVGQFEADSIVILLENVEMLRPLTFSFAASVLRAADGRLLEVRVNRLTPEDGTFFAEAVVEGPAGARVVDCRPSDAISLALAVGAPIRVAVAVMDAEGEPRERFVEVPEGTLTAAQGAQRIRELQARAREEWTRVAQERARRRGQA
jgi:RNA polymerase sigma factor (sigma-70 family)